MAAEFSFTVYNSSPAKAAPLVALGAKQALSLEDAVKDADLVLSSLLNDLAVLSVSADMLPYMRSGAVHIGLSTVLPNTAEQLLELHNEFQVNYVST